MRERPRVVALRAFASSASLACAFFIALGVPFGVPLGAQTEAASAGTSSPVVRACANARLPREILDGPVATPKDPLRAIDVAAPAARLHLAVAADEREREYGLMCVTHLRAGRGMIFVFPFESAWEFWMKNTLVPLDMIWVTASGEVTTIAPAVPAVTRTTPDAALPRRRGRGVYVIELGAHEAAADGIVVGTHLTLPALQATR